MLKRDWRLFLRCLIPAILLTAVFAAVSFAASFAAARGAESVYTPARLALVDREDSLFSRMLISMVSETEYISGLLEMEKCPDEARAEELLRSGEYAAVIVLPENFVDDILRGEESRGRIILSASAAAHSEIVESVANFGGLMLAAGQYAVFSGEELISLYELGGDFHSGFLAWVNDALLTEALEAGEKYFRVEMLDYGSAGLGLAQWYGLCWLSFVLFICSMFFEKLFRRDLERGLLCRLKAAGVGDLRFCAGKLLYPFLFRVVLSAPLLFLLPDIGVIEFLPACLGIFAASLMGFALILSGEKGSVICALLAFAGIFLGGGVIPRQLLPETVLALAEFTPAGAVQTLLAPLFGGRLSAVGAASTALYCCAAVLLIRHRLRFERIRGEQQ